MEDIVIFDESYALVLYVPKYKLIKIVWNGNVTNNQYREAFLVGLEFQEKTGSLVRNFLSDVRDQGVINPDNRKWFETVALPRAIKQGLKRAAVVFDGNLFKKYYLNIILQAANYFKLPLKFFSSTEEAYEWFLSYDDEE